MRVVPCELRVANAFVSMHHRHHKPDRGHRFSIAVVDDGGGVRGVAIVGRPKGRAIDYGRVVEVTRVCTDGSRNCCSMLYGAAARAAREMGFELAITYTLEHEPGTTLVASGWTRDGVVRRNGVGWHNRPGRANANPEPKVRWSKRLR